MYTTLTAKQEPAMAQEMDRQPGVKAFLESLLNPEYIDALTKV